MAVHVPCGAGAESSGAWSVVNIDALEVEVTTIEAHCVGGVGGYLAWAWVSHLSSDGAPQSKMFPGAWGAEALIFLDSCIPVTLLF